MKKYLLPFSLLILASLFILSFTGPKSFRAERNAFDTTVLPFLALAREYKGVSVVNKQGLITLISGLENDYYQLDSNNRTGYLYVEAKMDRFVNESIKRIPLNISIVIDRSGSMNGEKMEFARKAAKGIIDKLTPQDFVSVVIYDEYIDVIQAATAVVYKDSIKAKIEKIKPRGSTNLWGGSERGYEQVKANYKKNYINRVLLISDGRANAGMIHNHRIRARVQEYKDIEGITISTFGVGLDYNEILMTEMAETGAGNYYFIDKADKMAAMFDKELNGLMNVIAQDAELRIAIPKGITIDQVFPFKYEQQDAEIVIKFRDLFSEESKGVMIRFRLDDKTNKELKFLSRLTYNDIADSKQRLINNVNPLNPVKNVEAYMTHFNKPVIEQIVLNAANENMEKAMIEADKGNFEAGRRFLFVNRKMIDSYADSTARGEELENMYRLSGGYDYSLQTARNLSKDSLGKLQKINRSDNYKIRNKKFK